MRQYSQQPRALSAIRRLSKLLTPSSLIARRLNTEVLHEFRQSRSAELRQVAEGLNVCHLVAFDLLGQPQQLSILLRGQGFGLPLDFQLIEPLLQAGWQSLVDSAEQLGFSWPDQGRRATSAQLKDCPHEGVQFSRIQLLHRLEQFLWGHIGLDLDGRHGFLPSRRQEKTLSIQDYRTRSFLTSAVGFLPIDHGNLNSSILNTIFLLDCSANTTSDLLDSGNGQTIFNDASSDTLTDSAGSDWFFAGTADKITDLSALDQAFLFGL